MNEILNPTSSLKSAIFLFIVFPTKRCDDVNTDVKCTYNKFCRWRVDSRKECHGIILSQCMGQNPISHHRCFDIYVA